MHRFPSLKTIITIDVTVSSQSYMCLPVLNPLADSELAGQRKLPAAAKNNKHAYNDMTPPLKLVLRHVIIDLQCTSMYNCYSCCIILLS